MVMTRRAGNLTKINVGNYASEQVHELKYLGTTLNNQSNMHREINIILISANQYSFALSNLFRSELLSQKSKE